MKKITLFLSLTLIIASCGAPSEKDAKKKTMELLDLLKNHEYEKMSDCYSAEFNSSETLEQRKEKFEQIEASVGPMVSYEFDVWTAMNVDERELLELKYNVKYQTAYLTHTFIVARDEGKVKVLRHSIASK